MAQVNEPSSLVTIDIPRLSKRDYIFLLLLLLFLFGVAGLLVRDLNSSIQESGKPVAELSFRENRVERKIGGKALWSAIGAPDQIFNYDTVRTDENSQAKLTLSTGTEIVLSNTALVTVIVDDAGISLGLDGGNIAVNSNGDDRAIRIESDNGVLNLNNGGSATVSQGEDGFSVDVTEGDAQFVDAGGKVYTVGASQSLTQQGGNFAVETNPFTTLSPGLASLLLSFEDSINTEFTWRVDDGFTSSIIEMSPVVDFSSDVQRYNLSESARTFETVLNVGRWYWRVGDSKEMSNVASFLIVHDQKPEPFAPEDGDIFYYIEKSPLIRLQWQSSKNVTSYKIQIFETGNLTNPIRDLTAQNSFLGIDDLPEGNYTWNVEASYTAFNRVEKSSSISFGIQQFTEDEIPDPEIQLDSDQISQYVLRRDGVIINWDSVGELNRYLVELSKDNQTFFKEIVRKNYINLPRNLDLGQYDISVTALNGEDEVSSSKRNFEIVKFVAINITLPRNNAKIFDDVPKFDFAWQDRNNGSDYLLEISPNANFSTVEFEENTSNRFLSVPTLEAGIYYSRVSLIFEDGVFAVSPVRLFELLRKLQPAPVVRTPVPFGNVDITIVGDLRIAWNPVFDTNFYTLNVVPVTAPSAAVSQNIFGLSWTAEDSKNLPIGRYNYELTAYASNNKGEIVQNSEVARGFFYVERSRLPSVSGIQIFQ